MLREPGSGPYLQQCAGRQGTGNRVVSEEAIFKEIQEISERRHASIVGQGDQEKFEETWRKIFS